MAKHVGREHALLLRVRDKYLWEYFHANAGYVATCGSSGEAMPLGHKETAPRTFKQGLQVGTVPTELSLADSLAATAGQQPASRGGRRRKQRGGRGKQ